MESRKHTHTHLSDLLVVFPLLIPPSHHPLVAHPDQQPQPDEGVVLAQYAKYLIQQPCPDPAAAQGPLAQSDAEVEVV